MEKPLIFRLKSPTTKEGYKRVKEEIRKQTGREFILLPNDVELAENKKDNGTKTAYICSPYSGDIKRNKAYARELTLQAIKDGYAPITPHLYITECLNDNEPLARDLGQVMAIQLLRKCDAIYIGSKFGVSQGMKAEIIIARLLELEERYEHRTN